MTLRAEGGLFSALSSFHTLQSARNLPAQDPYLPSDQGPRNIEVGIKHWVHRRLEDAGEACSERV